MSLKDIDVPPEAVLDRDQEQKSVRVLVVEGRPAVRALIERSLTREGYSVVAVGTAREAIEVFDRVKPRFQLAIIDAVLPSRSGTDVHRALSRRVGHLPVVFVADHPESHEVRAESTEGVWLTNPLSPVALFEAVDRALSGADQGNGNGKKAKAGA